MGNLAQAAGAPVQEFSKVAEAFAITGGQTEALSKSYKVLNGNIVDALADTNSKQAQTFSAMGISLRGLNGQVKTNTQVLLESADKFASYTTSAEKSTLAVALFGKAGADMLPFLNRGSEGLRELIGESSGVSEEFAKNAGDYEDNVHRMQAQTMELGKTVAQGILPYLIQFTDAILQNNKESGTFIAIALTVVDVLKGMAVAVRLIYLTFQVWGQILGTVASILYDWFSLIANGLIAAFESWGDTIRAVTNMILSLGESAAKVGEILYNFFSGNFKEAWNGSKATIEEMRTAIVKAAVDSGESWMKNGEKISSKMGETFSSIKAQAIALKNDLGKTIGSAVDFSLNLFDPKKGTSKETPKGTTNAPVVLVPDDAIANSIKGMEKLAEIQAKIQADALEGSEKVIASFKNEYDSQVAQINALDAFTDAKNEAKLEAYKSYL
jgi:hypothetical protein